METATAQSLTLHTDDGVPVAMDYAGRRWIVTDMPTRLRNSIWSIAVHDPRPGMYGWRFQATDPAGESLVFDVYAGAEDWHVHRVYS